MKLAPAPAPPPPPEEDEGAEEDAAAGAGTVSGETALASVAGGAVVGSGLASDMVDDSIDVNEGEKKSVV